MEEFKKQTLPPTDKVKEEVKKVKEEFKVTVNKLTASNGVTFVVCVDHPDRPKDAMPWDEGRMQVFDTSNEKHATIEAARWEAFFANKTFEDWI